MAKKSKLSEALTSSLAPESNFLKNIKTMTIAELIEEYAYSEAIVETVREPLIILDKDLKVKSANKGFYDTFQVKYKNTVGKHIYDLGNRQWDIPGLRELLEHILPKNVFFEDFEVEHDFEGIGKKIMLINARRIILEGNKTEMILVAIEDVTEKRLIEKRTERIISIASHELRTPITSIMAFMQILEKRLKDGMDDKSEKIMANVLQQLNELNSLIEDLFEVRRIKEGVIRVKKRKVDLNKLITDFAENAKHIYGEKRIALEGEVDAYVIGDKSRIRQIMDNLLSNAVKYSAKDSVVWINIEKKKDEVLISVKDRGKGIPKDLRKQIFEPYYHGRKEARHGMGMGLYIVYQLVKLHEGRIWFETKTNKGTTMYFTLPVAKK